MKYQSILYMNNQSIQHNLLKYFEGFIFVLFLCLCVNKHTMCSTCIGQKRATDPLVLELTDLCESLDVGSRKCPTSL